MAIGDPIARAVAARIYGDKSAFFECGFVGFQDTLWDVQGRHFFKNTYIEGGVDFIWGSGQSIYLVQDNDYYIFYSTSHKHSKYCNSISLANIFLGLQMARSRFQHMLMENIHVNIKEKKILTSNYTS